MAPILALGRKYDVPVIEDAAQALGSLSYDLHGPLLTFAERLSLGSATAAMAGKPEGEKAVQDLLNAIDAFIPEPVRAKAEVPLRRMLEWSR